MQPAPATAPVEEPVEEITAQDEQVEAHQDDNMDAVYATMLAHVMLAASCGFGMMIWSALSDEGDGLGALVFAMYFLFASF